MAVSGIRGGVGFISSIVCLIFFILLDADGLGVGGIS